MRIISEKVEEKAGIALIVICLMGIASIGLSYLGEIGYKIGLILFIATIGYCFSWIIDN